MTEETVFAAALEKSTPTERAAFLDEACAGDTALRDRVQALLQSHEHGGSFLQTPAAQRAVEELEEPAPSGSTPGQPFEGEQDETSLDFLAVSQKPGSLGRLGHYEVLEVIGRGGMGIVLKAMDQTLHRIVAIKVLGSALATSATARKRFVREAQAAAAVRNDHVIDIHAVAGEHNPPYLMMEYVSGESLQQRLDRAGPLELKEILRIGRQTACGLAAAHAQGLVHRDIKPANILLENGVERVKLTDFGLARAVDDASLSQSGVVAGTPQYMAPEQASGGAVDHRADLFSLGSVLYAMCTGRAPFRASGTMAVLKRVCEDTPRPIREINQEIPEWLAAVINKLHAKDPADRFQTAAEVADLLGQHLAHLQQPSLVPIPAACQPASPTRGRRTRAMGRRWTIAAAILVLLIGGLGLTEATGVTNLRATVIRIFTPEGTLVVEVNDPGVKVTIEGDGGLIITGAGPQEVGLRPGSYKLQAAKDGKPVRLDQELVMITRGDKQVVKVALERDAAAAKAAAKVEPGAFVVLAGKNLGERKFDTLADAVMNAGYGDTIEVRGNGPFISAPINIGNNALTIRAGEGFRPVIKLTLEGVETNARLIETAARLVLEGLELQYVGQRSRKEYLRHPNVVVCNQAPFWFANCRFLFTVDRRPSFYIAASGSQTCVLRNCEFLTFDCALLWHTPPGGGRCLIENCLYLGTHALSGGWYDGEKDNVLIYFARNTVVRPRFPSVTVNVTMTPNPRQPNPANQRLRVEASANIFDTDSVLEAGQVVEKLKPLRGAEAEALLVRLLDWRDQRNLYAPGASNVSWSVNHVAVDPHGPKNLAEWTRFWRQGDTASVEGLVRYQGGNLVGKSLLAPEKITPEDFRLRPDSAGYRAGKDSKDLGADVDLVGPGKAYERWKKTPEYQQWLKETGQKN